MNDIGFNLNDEYSIISESQDFAIGDFLVQFELKISENDFNEIVKKIKVDSSYRELINNDHSWSNSIINDMNKIDSYKYEGKYHYFLERFDPADQFLLVLDEKRKTLIFSYFDK